MESMPLFSERFVFIKIFLWFQLVSNKLNQFPSIFFLKNAIAVSVDLRTAVTIDLQSDDRVVLHAEDFGQTFSWTLTELAGNDYGG